MTAKLSIGIFSVLMFVLSAPSAFGIVTLTIDADTKNLFFTGSDSGTPIDAGKGFGRIAWEIGPFESVGTNGINILGDISPTVTSSGIISTGFRMDESTALISFKTADTNFGTWTFDGTIHDYSFLSQDREDFLEGLIGSGIPVFEGTGFSPIAVVAASPASSTFVDIGTDVIGSAGGGSTTTGGVDFDFDNVTGDGTFTADYDTVSPAELNALLPPGAEPLINFGLPGDPAQIWNIDFDGTFTGDVSLTLSYDDTILSVLEADLGLWHYDDGAWVQETNGFILDTIANTITVEVDSFSPFMLGVAPVPEPSTYALAGIGLAVLVPLAWRRRRRAAR